MPPETRQEIFERKFHSGRFVLLYSVFTRPYPKEKFLLIASVNPRPLCLVVNSEINEFIKARPRLLRCQVALAQRDYSFLDYDSFLDCTEAIAHFSREEIEAQAIPQMSRLKDAITSPTRAQVIEAIEASETIALRYKLWMLNELKT